MPAIISPACAFLSGKRGSNSRPSAWEADALPTELLPHIALFNRYKGTAIFRV